MARSLVLGLANTFEWTEWCKEGMRPSHLPADPSSTHKGGGWQGWVHWLGSGNLKKPSKFAPFGQALTFAQSLGLANHKAWLVWCKEGRRPPNVPSHPHRTYKDGGWQGWGHWLGTGNTGNNTPPFLPFEEVLAMARSLNLASVARSSGGCGVRKACGHPTCPPTQTRSTRAAGGRQPGKPVPAICQSAGRGAVPQPGQ